MNLVNATLDISPQRLNFPLATLHPRQLHSHAVRVANLPDDVTSVVLRVFKVGLAAFFDIPCSRRPGGDAIAYCIGTCFPDTGSAKYEVHAYDAKGNATALGEGLVEVEAFTVSGTPVDPGASVTLDHIKDANGNLHTIKAVPDGAGGYTTIIDDAS